MSDVVFSAIVAPMDVRLSPNERHVMALVANWRAYDINDVVRHGDISLDALCRRTTMAKEDVFFAVARLEVLGFLPSGAIR